MTMPASLTSPLLTDKAPHAFAFLRRLAARRRAYRRAMTEFSYLSNAELADLGIGRDDFIKLAREVARLEA
ncbi:protein of unknown function [Arboricoccus pini]|uniref:YjiS-like domain-containing protein n=2 Tax=Arboricoccus pini TaxID=1963835 RepID=A0A212RCY6_9PROT|nr:protein of unknown function [Arboricoccus pini]